MGGDLLVPFNPEMYILYVGTTYKCIDGRESSSSTSRKPSERGLDWILWQWWCVASRHQHLLPSWSNTFVRIFRPGAAFPSFALTFSRSIVVSYFPCYFFFLRLFSLLFAGPCRTMLYIFACSSRELVRYCVCLLICIMGFSSLFASKGAGRFCTPAFGRHPRLNLTGRERALYSYEI